MASRLAALLLLGVICVEFAAGKTRSYIALAVKWIHISECFQCRCKHLTQPNFKSKRSMQGRNCRWPCLTHALSYSPFWICLSIFLQLRSWWTAVRRPLQSFFRSNLLKATPFRMLGMVATSALLRKCKIFILISQKKVLSSDPLLNGYSSWSILFFYAVS